jgi:hypothetical protein
MGNEVRVRVRRVIGRASRYDDDEPDLKEKTNIYLSYTVEAFCSTIMFLYFIIMESSTAKLLSLYLH